MEPVTDKKERVRRMFDGIARRYDLLNHLLSAGIDRQWRRGTARQAAEGNPRRVLDVATGTGDLAIRLARTLPDAAVTGVDLSPEMLRIGREKIARAFPGRDIPMIEGEAEALPFADGSFEAVTASFGVRNFADIPSGLRQMHRVLTPGGRACILEFSMPRRGNPLGALYVFYFRRLLPQVGRWVSGDRDAYTYLPESVDEFPYGERFETLLREAGFAAVSSRPLTGGVATLYTAVKAPHSATSSDQ